MNTDRRYINVGRLCSLLGLAVLLLLSRLASAEDLSGSYTWKPVKIGAGGFMRGMVVHPTDPNVRYARGDVDNIYRWDNANNTWMPMQVAGTLPASVTAAPGSAGAGPIAVDPNNSNVVLCGWRIIRSFDIHATWPDVNFNVYRSTDGGRTFTAGNLSLPNDDFSDEQRGERLMIDPNNSNVVYLGTKTHGLWRSMDGGVNWTNVTANGAPAASSNVVLPRFDPGAGTVSFLGQTVSRRIYLTMNSGPILQSNDGGSSWTNISSGQEIDGQAGFATVDSAGNLWVAHVGNAFPYKKPRSSNTFTVSLTPHPVLSIAVDPTNPNRVFTIGGGGAVQRSLDGGATWTNLGATLNYSTTQEIQWLRPSPIRPNGHFLSNAGLYMDPNGRLWVPCGNDGVITCTPNDATDSATNRPVWTAAAQGIEEMVGQTVTVPPGGLPLFAVEDEGLFTIQNPDVFNALHHGLDYWTNNTGLSLGQDVAYCPNRPSYVVLTSDNGFYGREPTAAQLYSGYSADGGITWQKFSSIQSGTHPCVLYCGMIAVSPRPAGQENNPPGADNIVWAPANVLLNRKTPAPFYSFDGGQTWSQTQSFNNVSGATIENKCGGTYTFMGFQQGPWTNLLHQHSLEADPLVPGTFYFMVTNGGFWKSTDGGVTWVQQAGTADLPSATHHGHLRANPFASGDLWFVDGHEGATAHGLYHTTNGGQSFTRNPAFTYAWEVALGKSATPGGYPAVYVYGLLAGDPNWGIFRSTDQGATWDRISYYPYGLMNTPSGMAASWDVFGQVYISFTGNSLAYGTPTAPASAPNPPTDLAATAGDGQVSLTWLASFGATSYNVHRGTTPGGQSATPIATGITTNSYTNTGLTNGTTYYYKVTATNSVGTSGYSNEASATPAPQPPAAPTDLLALAGDMQISLTWSASSGADSYNIYRATSPGGQGTTPIATGITSTSFTNTGLTNGTTYYYKVAAVNAVGTGPLSSEVNAKPTTANAQIASASSAPTVDGSVDSVWSSATTYPMPNVTGTIPSGATNSGSWQALWDSTNLYVLVTIQDSTVLSGSDSIEIYVEGNNAKATTYSNVAWQWVFTNGSSTIQQYSGGSSGSNTAGIVKGEASISGGWRMEAKIPWSTIGITAFANNNIGLDVAYNNYNVAGTRANKLFWYSTTDNNWQNPSLFGTAKLMAPTGSLPPAPTGLTATAGNGQVGLSWNASAGATSYNVKRSTTSGSGYTTIASPTTTSYTNTGLTNGTTYYYVVSAVNSAGESADSSQVSATPTAPATDATIASGTAIIDGAEEAAWNDATAYNVATLIGGTVSSNADLSGTWKAMWDSTNLYVLCDVTDNAKRNNSSIVWDDDSVEIYIDGNNDKSATYDSNDRQIVCGWGDTTPVEAAGRNITGVGFAKTDPTGTSYRIEVKIPWSTLGVTASSGKLIGIDVHFNDDDNSGGRDGKLSWFATADNSWGNPGTFGTADLSGGTPPQPPAAPTNLTATAGDAQVALSWGASTGATSYNIKRSTTSGGPYSTITSPTTTSYTNTGLTNGVTYYYVVSAVNSNGESGNSSQASATPTGGTVAAPTFSPPAGSYTSAQSVTISTATSGASIRFTTNGTNPTSTTGTLYSGPVSISTTTTLKAIAYKSGMTDSAVTSGVYTIEAGSGGTASIAAGTATIDASVEPAWDNATPYSINNITGTIGSTSDCSGTFKGLWDSTNLYVLVEVTDDDKQNDSTDPWADDSVELYLDGNNDKTTTYDANDRQYVFGWGDTAVVEAFGRSATGVTFAKADPASTSYRIEAKVPWSTLGVTKSAGQNIGIDVHINDDDAGGAREGKRQWNDVTDGAWGNPSLFGVGSLQAGGSPPAAPTGLAATAGDGQVALSWSASSGATSYNVKRSTTSGGPYSTINSPTTTSYTNTGLTNGTTYYYVVSAANSNGESANSSQVSATPRAAGTPMAQINSGGPAVSPYVADSSFSGGNTASTTNTITTTGVTNPAPMAVYQTNRWGAMTYTIGSLTPGGNYTVRLHFAETFWSAIGQRKFNVAINGTTVLTNFDILANAGGQFKANVQQFPATANASAQIVIAFSVGAVDQPLVSGVEVLTSGTDPSQYNFESGTQNWGVGGSGLPGTIASSADRAYLGTRSLALTINGSAAGTAEISVGGPTTPGGATVFYRVWIPAGSAITSVSPYVLGGSPNHTWTAGSYPIGSLTAGAWNTLSVTVPASGSAPLGSLGIQFNTSGPWTGTVYVDSIGW